MSCSCLISGRTMKTQRSYNGPIWLGCGARHRESAWLVTTHSGSRSTFCGTYALAQPIARVAKVACSGADCGSGAQARLCWAFCCHACAASHLSGLSNQLLTVLCSFKQGHSLRLSCRCTWRARESLVVAHDAGPDRRQAGHLSAVRRRIVSRSAAR